MKILPRLSKIKFTDINSTYFISIGEMDHNLGQFYASGDIKSEWTYNNQTKSTIFRQNDIAFSDNGFFQAKSNCIHKGSQSASYPYEEFQNGWTLTALSNNAYFICIQYYASDLLNQTDALSIYDYRVINGSAQINLNQNDHMLVLQGKPVINGQEKGFKSWIISSSNQVLDVNSEQEQSVLILFR